MKQLIDLSRLVQTILEEGAPADVTVAADTDSDSGAETPFLLWTAINEGQYDVGLWSAILSIVVICEPADSWRILSSIYTLVHSWDTPGVGVLGSEKVGVNEVSDMGVFDLIHQTVINGKSLEQHSGQFRLRIRDWS